MEKVKLYNLEYWVGQRHLETLLIGKEKALCNWMINQKVAAGSHTRKNFKIKTHETKPIINPTSIANARDVVLKKG